MAALAEAGDAAGMMVKFMTGVGMPPEAVESFQQSPAWADYEAVALTLEHDYRILAEATDGNRPPERWQRAKMPVLVVDGDASFPFMEAGADWVAAALPNAARRRLAGQNHEFDPQVLGPVVAEFFSR